MVSPALPTLTRQRVSASAGRNGALAALLALFLDLVWRTTSAPAGAPSLPDTVVAAVARLTPLAIFGWATENLGSLAQNTLFALVLIGFVAAGYVGGSVAARMIAAGRVGTGWRARAMAAGIVAAVFFLGLTCVIFPLAREGFFAAGSAFQGLLLAQAAIVSAIWAVSWSVLEIAAAPAMAAETGEAGERVSRRSALQSLATAGLAVGVALLGWRLAKAPAAGDVTAQRQAAADIAARARGAEPATSGDTAVTGGAATENTVEKPEPARKQWDPSPDEPFAELEAAGKLTPVITSVADFYHVSKNISDPVVDSNDWSLSITGLVSKPLTLTYQDVIDRSKTKNITTLSCISNELNGDLAGTAEWTGFPLRELLEEAGVDAKAVDIVFHAADGYDDSIPVAIGMNPSTLVVTGMNGEPLPPDHGFPARLIIPPIYGMKNVKWVEKIEVVDYDYQGYWQTRGWSDPAPYQIWGRIDTPAPGEQIPPGDALTAGVAAAGNRGIYRVEISLDEGATWADATLEPSINPNFTWVRWVFPFAAASPATKIWMRATDGEGNVAPEERRPPLPDGATGWPDRAVRVA